MPKHPPSEEDLPSGSTTGILQKILDLFTVLITSVVRRGAIAVETTETVTAPEKFHLGGDFSSWELQARRYVDTFESSRQPNALLNLLAGEALTIALEDEIVKNAVTEETYQRLRSTLTPGALALDYRREFHERRQRHGEDIQTFARQLKRLARQGFPTEPVERRAERVLERLVEGVTSRKVCERFLRNPPTELEQAIEVGRHIEAVTNSLEKNFGHELEVNAAVQPPRRNYQRDTWNRGRTQTNWIGNGCYYCQRFGRFARTCGHNRKRPGESAFTFNRPTFNEFEGRGADIERVIHLTIALSQNRRLPVAPITINGRRISCLIDTGASCSLVGSKVAVSLAGRKWRYSHNKLLAVNGTPLTVRGKMDVEMNMAGTHFSHEVMVIDRLPWDVILGVDVLERLNCRIDLVQKKLFISQPTTWQRGCTVKAARPHTDEISTITPNPSNIEEQISELTQACKGQAGGEDDQRKDGLTELIREYIDVFAWNATMPGRTGMVKHQIDTGNCMPIRTPPRRIPAHYQPELQEMIEQMLKNNIIQPSNSPWAAPVVLVKKKDGKLRLCVDYRLLNSVTKRDSFPLPRTDDVLEALNGSCWFSTLDLASGYWQVEVDEVDRSKTAFTLPSGLYEFQTMPFGLVNAPATFQRLMQSVLRDLVPQKCLVYLDDVIAHGPSPREHLANLRIILDRLRHVGLKLNPVKCRLMQEEVNFLGHVISKEGIQTDRAKTAQVEQWPIPLTVTEVRSFLGLASYYRRFVRNFSTIAEPLNALLGKDCEFVWAEAQQRSFDQLRKALCESPILAFPDFAVEAGEFILDTDASDHGLGAVLSQKGKTGEEHVIAYGSRSLNKREKNYCTTRKEMLALVFFLKQYRHYLLGKKFVVRTDHQSLTWLRNFRDPEGQIARWQEYLQEYAFECYHRPGKQHGNADALSRRPNRDHGDCPSCTTQHVALISLQNRTEGWSELQKDDPELTVIYERISTSGIRPTGEELAGCSWETRCLWALWEQLVMVDGILYIQYGPTYTRRIVVPQTKVAKVLENLHRELGHAGQNKMDEAARARFWWSHQRRDVANFCRSCSSCARFKNPIPHYRAPLQPVQTGYPNEIVGVDLMGPLPETCQGKRYILVMVDHFTKWAEVVPLSAIDAPSVAKAIFGKWICNWGAPGQLHSDKGSNFESATMHELCRLMKIDKTRTTSYHPEGNGLVERTNRTLKGLMKAFVEDVQQWDEVLPQCVMAYRSTVHSSTNQTPSFMWTGRELRLPSDLQTPYLGRLPLLTTEYVISLRDTIVRSHELARRHLNAARRRQKEYYDKKAHGAPLLVGAKVYLHTDVPSPGVPAKLHREWKGPFVVERVLSDTLCYIRSTDSCQKPMVVHFNRLKPAEASTEAEESEEVPEIGAEVEISNDAPEAPGRCLINEGVV